MIAADLDSENVRAVDDEDDIGPNLEDRLALMSKMHRIRDDLLPFLDKIDSVFSCVRLTLREMETVKSNLENFADVWDKSGIVKKTPQNQTGNHNQDAGWQ